MKIPKLIFQTWETKDIPYFSNLTHTWISKNRDYKYFLFDERDRKHFIYKNFDTNVFKAYCNIKAGAFRADLWRYCILYKYGGFYADIDTLCLNSLNDLVEDDVDFITPVDLNQLEREGKHNLANAFIGSIPKNPILMDCINRVVYNVENKIVPQSPLDFSGPSVLGKSVNRFLDQNELSAFKGKEGYIEHNKMKIKLLSFESPSEYVFDKTKDKILFQNKNGNPEIQKIYELEKSKINFNCWLTGVHFGDLFHK